MIITDEELKTLLISNRGFLQKQNEAIRELSKKIDRLNSEANILQMYLIRIQKDHAEFSEFQKSLNGICNSIQSEDAKRDKK